MRSSMKAEHMERCHVVISVNGNSSVGTGRPAPCCRCPLAPRGLWLKMLKRRWGHHIQRVDAGLSDARTKARVPEWKRIWWHEQMSWEHWNWTQNYSVGDIVHFDNLKFDLLPTKAVAVKKSDWFYDLWRSMNCKLTTPPSQKKQYIGGHFRNVFWLDPFL